MGKIIIKSSDSNVLVWREKHIAMVSNYISYSNIVKGGYEGTKLIG
jgi:hypothetical protein